MSSAASPFWGEDRLLQGRALHRIQTVEHGGERRPLEHAGRRRSEGGRGRCGSRDQRADDPYVAAAGTDRCWATELRSDERQPRDRCAEPAFRESRAGLDIEGCPMLPPLQGDCYDNAMVESFRSRMQVERLDRKRWKTRLEPSTAIFDYLEIFHNRHCRHSALGMLTPVEHEIQNASPLRPKHVAVTEPEAAWRMCWTGVRRGAPPSCRERTRGPAEHPEAVPQTGRRRRRQV